ncbi:ash family protein [Salmonella enterica]|nr:ash family protein [Salmonella enterica]
MMSMKPSKALDHLNHWRYSDPAPHKTGAGIGTPNLYKATQDAESVFFVVCHVSHSMAWCALFNAGSAAAITHNGAYHVANNGVMCSNCCVGQVLYPRALMNALRRQRMVALAGLPKGRPVSLYAGSSNPVNVTAPIEIGTSGGDSLNLYKEAA